MNGCPDVTDETKAKYSFDDLAKVLELTAADLGLPADDPMVYARSEHYCKATSKLIMQSRAWAAVEQVAAVLRER